MRGSWAACSPSSPPLFCTAPSGSPSPTASSIPACWGTLFELLSLWFLAGFLENSHSPGWVTSLYAVLRAGDSRRRNRDLCVRRPLGYAVAEIPLYGCFGRHLRPAGGHRRLYGDMQFMLFPLPIGIKARYLAAIYALVAIAMLFGQQSMYAFAQLGGALAGLLYHPPGPAPWSFFCLQREMVCPAQPLLPLEAPPRRPQIRGLYARPGPHHPLRRLRPPHR